MEQISHLLSIWDSWECMLMKIIKGKWIFIIFCWLQHGGYFFGWNGLWVPYSDYAFSVKKIEIWHSGCIKEKSIFKSVRNTCIFYQCLLWVFLGFDVAICKITGCFGIKTLLHVTRQCKLRFLDINMHIIEQNIHILCNMMSYECHLMKIIKG